ncbi:ATP phosphoribosyltransferase [Streptomyces sp. ST2-7A]|uniref:ATP phosphoribosyltransferase n=1 Tax=Streptomyces sp. ST2-7A TaxID=2907214 RepID=UPI001F1C4308|nr:ATP phosphoribosyltransferase [Streptomyces sp. ST2-7A]MCE7079665.1 ATP phosphoribosyltransferase [Streptomyces sp. ST2-7A]
MLRIAVPNKGSLSGPAATMLQEAGYRQRKDSRELVLIDADNQVEFFFLRPRDIAVYVGSGKLDIGITGRDLLLDSGAEAEEIMALGFAASTLRYAARPGGVRDVSQFDGLTVATSFAGVVEHHLGENGVNASVVRLDGAVETAIQLGVADVIADVVETGTTLRNAGLEIIGDPVLASEAVVARRRGADTADPKVRQFLRRLKGVLVARRYVMMDYDIRAELVEKAVALTPGLESPTVSPLHDRGWVAVRSMVPTREAQRIMDDLDELGARAILTTTIHACRL